MSSEPRSPACSTNCLPEVSRVMMGGCSSPANSFLVSSDLPATAPNKAPDNKVFRPEMPDAATRGRTTQKRVSSAVKLSASLVSCTVVKTCERSLLSVIDCTRPISTSLYFTLVLPASSPSAEEKLIVITGPRSINILATSVRPTTAATMGINHTSEGSQLRWRARFGSGNCCEGVVCSVIHYPFFIALAGRHVATARRSHWKPAHPDPRSGADQNSATPAWSAPLPIRRLRRRLPP